MMDNISIKHICSILVSVLYCTLHIFIKFTTLRVTKANSKITTIRMWYSVNVISFTYK